jgi:DMSO/TMAO reductase YedYZ heme-binding membrane subunit
VLRKIHAPLGIITTMIVFMHCSVAERASGTSSVVGAILLVCMLALCLTWLLKRLIPRYWLKLHRGITVIILIVGLNF